VKKQYKKNSFRLFEAICCLVPAGKHCSQLYIQYPVFSISRSAISGQSDFGRIISGGVLHHNESNNTLLLDTMAQNS
jgi:hypothetical protein